MEQLLHLLQQTFQLCLIQGGRCAAADINILHHEASAVCRKPIQFSEHGIQIFIHPIFILMERIRRKGAVQTSGWTEGNPDIQADFLRAVILQNFSFRLCHLERQCRLMRHHKIILRQKSKTFLVRFALLQQAADELCRAHACQQSPLGANSRFRLQQLINRPLDDALLFLFRQHFFVIFHRPCGSLLPTAIKHCRSNALFHLAFYGNLRICHCVRADIMAVCQKYLYHCLHIVLQLMSLQNIADGFRIHTHQNSFSLSSSSVTGPSLTRATFISVWKMPCCTFLMPSASAFAHSLSNNPLAISGAAPLL